MTWRRGIALLLVAAAVALPATGCGSDGDASAAGAATETDAGIVEEGESADAGVLSSAAQRTLSAGSARVGVRMTTGGDGIPDRTLGGEGVFDFERDAGAITLDFAGAEGAYAPNAQIVFADRAVYYGLAEGFLPPGKRWLKLDLEEIEDASADEISSFIQGSQADPAQYLIWLQALDPEATRYGTQQVRGVETTRYDATVDLERLAELSPPGREDVWRAYVESMQEGLGLTEIPVQAWVDGDGLVRRVRHGYVFGPEGQQARAETVAELWDFGIAVSVDPPPPDQVADMGDIVRP